MRNLNRTSVRGSQSDRLSAYDMFPNSGTVLVDFDPDQSQLVSMRDQISKVATWFHHLRRQPIHLEISPIADDEPLEAIEQRQALRHIFDGGIEALLF
ncbi:MAG: hypothetical protein WAU79_13415, partial [Bradyrhizobium sp.]